MRPAAFLTLFFHLFTAGQPVGVGGAMRTGCGCYQECQAAQGKAASDPTPTLTPALIPAPFSSEPNYYFVLSSLWERCFQGLLSLLPP